MSSVYFEDCNVEVHGFSYTTTEIRENRADHLTVPLDGRIHILMIHGGDASHLPFDKNALGASDFSYIALGHVHKPEILIPDKMAYPGSPEPLDKTETGVHGIIRGEIHPKGHIPGISAPVPFSVYPPGGKYHPGHHQHGAGDEDLPGDRTAGTPPYLPFPHPGHEGS